jgi:hypothetical protein
MKSNLKNFFLLPAYTLLMQLCLLSSPLSQKTPVPTISEHNKASTKSSLTCHDEHNCIAFSQKNKEQALLGVSGHSIQFLFFELFLLAVQSGFFYSLYRHGNTNRHLSFFILKKLCHDSQRTIESICTVFQIFYLKIQNLFSEHQHQCCIAYIHFSSRLHLV